MGRQGDGETGRQGVGETCQTFVPSPLRVYAGMQTRSGDAVARLVLRYINQAHADDSPLQRIRALTHGLLSFPTTMKDIFSGHCEVAQRLGERLGLSGNLIRGLGQLYER
jgi:hypothetical protein